LLEIWAETTANARVAQKTMNMVIFIAIFSADAVGYTDYPVYSA